MKTYKKQAVVEASKHFGIEVNNHINCRKDIHHNILLNYAKSALHDRELVKNFIKHVKKAN